MCPNVNDLNEFLTASDVNDGDVITFLNAGEIKDVDFSRSRDGSDVRKVLQIDVSLPDGKEKIVTINKTSRKSLSTKYGADTEDWVEKEAKVVILKQNVGGTIKDVIYLEPVA